MDNSSKLIQNDYISVDALNRFSLTLDCDPEFQEGTTVPKLWHWLYFLPRVKASDTGYDGHPKTGGFIPSITGLDRRMWAGGRLKFYNNLYASKNAIRESKILNITEKNGRSGKLAFVLASHKIYQDNRLILSEEHDVVYKQAPKSPTTVEMVNTSLEPVTQKAQWSETVKPDPVLLFKYSALTFNGHRIHYDREFCKNEFGFPGIVVHGPLLATLMMELVRKNLPEARVLEYSFRAMGPIFDFQTFSVEGYCEGDTVSLWIKNDRGYQTMSAIAKIS